ncbi:MAG: MBL fold metallo-hydrolase [Ruminococcaceae bacterium]|nr:MBL fold metallo-hydrolase [Oscillospiraceae bacterium]
MKRLTALLLALMLLLTCCSAPVEDLFDGADSDQNINAGYTNYSPPDIEDGDAQGDFFGDIETEIDRPENGKPTVEDPNEDKPTVEDPNEDKPTVEDPNEDKPTVEDPNEDKPTVEDPNEDKPTVEDPNEDKPTVEDPNEDKPTVEDPNEDKPTVDQPNEDKPTVDQPNEDKPTVDQPNEDKPTVDQPNVDKPTVDQPETPEISHDYKATVTAPTCKSEGYTTYTCSICGDSYVTDRVSTVPHNYKSTVTAPTCVKSGYTTYTCTVCSTSYTSNTVAATGHNWKAATTSAPKTCTTCGATEGSKLPSTDSSSSSSGSSSSSSSSGSSSSSSSSGYSEKLYVSYINVGQGDSILIKVGDCDILIDAGTSSYGSTVSSYLKSQGVDDIELLINTHPDSDHCGGLTAVLNSFVVEQVWISPKTSTTTVYKNFISAVNSEGLTAKKPTVGTVYKYEYLTLTVLYASTGSDSNNSSIVTMLEYGSYKFLFTGDAGEEVENKLVSSGANLSCDVLKVGHHGSKYSSTASFLSKTGADYGVICVGSNSYGHPTADALSRLSSAGITVYRTDKDGNVVFSTNGATLTLPGGGTVSGGSGSGTSSGGSSSGSTSSGSSSSGSSSSSTEYFIGNTETKVFHLPTCGNLPAASKRNTMYNYWWIINIAGYTPCGRCLKNYSGGGSESTTSYIANTESKVYHLSTCSYLPAASKREVIYSTAGYTPCGHCIKKATSTSDTSGGDVGAVQLLSYAYVSVSSKRELLVVV